LETKVDDLTKELDQAQRDSTATRDLLDAKVSEVEAAKAHLMEVESGH
jgi:hypothetical protein